MAGRIELFTAEFKENFSLALTAVQESFSEELSRLDSWERQSRLVDSSTQTVRGVEKLKLAQDALSELQGIIAIRDIEERAMQLAAFSGQFAAKSPDGIKADFQSLIRAILTSLFDSLSRKEEASFSESILEPLKRYIEDFKEQTSAASEAYYEYHQSGISNRLRALQTLNETVLRLEASIQRDTHFTVFFQNDSWTGGFTGQVLPPRQSSVGLTVSFSQADRNLRVKVGEVVQVLDKQEDFDRLTPSELEALIAHLGHIEKKAIILQKAFIPYVRVAGSNPFREIKAFCESNDILLSNIGYEAEHARVQRFANEQHLAIETLLAQVRLMKEMAQKAQLAHEQSRFRPIAGSVSSSPSSVPSFTDASSLGSQADASPGGTPVSSTDNLIANFQIFTVIALKNRQTLKEEYEAALVCELESKREDQENNNTHLHESVVSSPNTLDGPGLKARAKRFAQALSHHIVSARGDQNTASTPTNVREGKGAPATESVGLFIAFFEAIQRINDPDMLYQFYQDAATKHLPQGMSLEKYEQGHKPSMNKAPEMLKLLNRATKHRLLHLAANGAVLDTDTHVNRVLKMNHGYFTNDKTNSFLAYEAILKIRAPKEDRPKLVQAKKEALKYFKKSTDLTWFKSLKKAYPATKNALIGTLKFEEATLLNQHLDSAIEASLSRVYSVESASSVSEGGHYPSQPNSRGVSPLPDEMKAPGARDRRPSSAREAPQVASPVDRRASASHTFFTLHKDGSFKPMTSEQQVQLLITFNERLIAERESGIDALASDAESMHEIFQTLATLVAKQGPRLDRIEAKLDQTLHSVAHGVDDLLSVLEQSGGALSDSERQDLNHYIEQNTLGFTGQAQAQVSQFADWLCARPAGELIALRAARLDARRAVNHGRYAGHQVVGAGAYAVPAL